MKLLVEKKDGCLHPVYNSDYEALQECKLKEGEVYEIEVKKKRNYEFHKKYFSLLNLCYDNQDTFSDFEELRYYLVCKAGYFKRVKTEKGEMIIPLSISFAKMDNIEFEQLYKKTIDVICHFIDVEKRDIFNEVINYI